MIILRLSWEGGATHELRWLGETPGVRQGRTRGEKG